VVAGSLFLCGHTTRRPHNRCGHYLSGRERPKAAERSAWALSRISSERRASTRFCRVLGHDLRNPLSPLPRVQASSQASGFRADLQTHRSNSRRRRAHGQDDRPDPRLHALRLGTGLPVDAKAMNLGDLTGAIVAEFRRRRHAADSVRVFRRSRGTWDRDRLGRCFPTSWQCAPSRRVRNAHLRGHRWPGTELCDGEGEQRGTIPPDLLPVTLNRCGWGRASRPLARTRARALHHAAIVAAHGGASAGIE